jgi:hypothetical protein
MPWVNRPPQPGGLKGRENLLHREFLAETLAAFQAALDGCLSRPRASPSAQPWARFSRPVGPMEARRPTFPGAPRRRQAGRFSRQACLDVRSAGNAGRSIRSPGGSPCAAGSCPRLAGSRLCLAGSCPRLAGKSTCARGGSLCATGDRPRAAGHRTCVPGESL